MGAELLSSRAIRAMIQQSLVKAAPDLWVERTTKLFNSDQESETYKWLSDVPALREWKGARHVADFKDFGITVVNSPFEATIQVKKRERRRDKVGQLQMKIGDLSRRSMTHWSKISTELLETNPTAYDGVPFFNASHSELDSGTQSNLLGYDATTAADPTAAEMKNAILDCVQAMVGFKDSVGEPVSEDASEFLVMVPTNMMAATAAALGNSVIVESGGAVSNTIQALGNFGFRFVVNARLTSATGFYIFRTDAMVPTIIRQQEFGPNISAKAEGSDYEHDFNAHEYGVDCDRAVAPGRWQNAVKLVFV